MSLEDVRSALSRARRRTSPRAASARPLAGDRRRRPAARCDGVAGRRHPCRAPGDVAVPAQSPDQRSSSTRRSRRRGTAGHRREATGSARRSSAPARARVRAPPGSRRRAARRHRDGHRRRREPARRRLVRRRAHGDGDRPPPAGREHPRGHRPREAAVARAHAGDPAGASTSRSRSIAPRTIRASVHDVERSLLISIAPRRRWSCSCSCAALRATAIPSVVVPLSLIATFGVDVPARLLASTTCR